MNQQGINRIINQISTFIINRPKTVLMMCVLIFLIFRNFWLTLIATVNLGLCLIWTMGMFRPL